MRSVAQQHFLDLCAVRGEPTTATADPEGSFYTFENVLCGPFSPLVSAASGGYVKRSSGFWGRMPPPLAPEAGG